MPYIKAEEREQFNKKLDDFPDMVNKGQLEYCIFKLMVLYIQNKEKRYSTLHDTCYAAAHCADEFRRRFLDSRENSARETNGDIS